MIKYVYTTRNKKSGNFNNPLLHDFPKENAAEVFAISAKEANVEAVKELEVYYLGEFDTKTGVFTSSVEYVIDLGAVLSGTESSEKES